MISLLVLTIATSLFPARADDRAAPSSTSPIDLKTVLRDCDRLVLARVKDVREFPRARGTIGPSPVIRVAELEVVDAPFGSTKERLFVRMPEKGTSPIGLLLWPLGEDLRMNDADWEDLPRIEEKLSPDPLWMPSISLQGPWPVFDRNGVRRVSIPIVLIPPKLPDEDGPPTRATMELDLDPLMSSVRTELERAEPRIEASIVGTGPGSWEVTIDAWKHGDCRAASDTKFEWDEAQRSRWKAALDAARFASLPSRVGESEAPCGAVEVLSLVTHAGRQTVRIMGPIAKSTEERERLSRADGVWRALRDLVPKGR